MALTLRQLDAFKAVVEAGSFTAAASRLDLSQPAISQLVAALENYAQVRLFERASGKALPTPEGKALYAELKRMRVGLDFVERKISSLRHAGQSRLRIGLIHAYSLGLVSQTLAVFSQQHPDIDYYLQIRGSDTLRDLVAAGELDFAVVADESNLQGIRSSLVARVPAVVVVAAGHPFAKKTSINASQLAGARLLALNSEDLARQRLDKYLQEAGVTPRIHVETPYSSSVCSLAQAGLGIGIANPLTAVHYEPQGLVIRKFNSPVYFEAHLILPHNQPASGVARDWIGVFRAQLATFLKRFPMPKA